MCFCLSLNVFLVSERAEPQMTIPETGFQLDNLTTTSLDSRLRRPGPLRILMMSVVSEKRSASRSSRGLDTELRIQACFWYNGLHVPAWDHRLEVVIFLYLRITTGSSEGKESACSVGDLGWIPESGRRKWQPTPVLLSGKSYGQRSLVGYSSWGCTEQLPSG